MTIGVTFLYGTSIWPAFFHNFLSQVTWFEGASEQLEKIHSLFSFVHHYIGGPRWLAYSVQAVVQLGVVGTIIWLWRQKNPADYALKAAALAAGSLLMTPYILDYDLFVLLPAIVFLARHQLQHGFAPYSKLILVLLWLLPGFAKDLYVATMIPFGFLTILGTFVFVLYIVRWENERRVIAPQDDASS
jgi:hypothetical protein